MIFLKVVALIVVVVVVVVAVIVALFVVHIIELSRVMIKRLLRILELFIG